MFQVARSLGILDEVNRMKVVPGASPSSGLTNKNARYMEVNVPSQGQVLGEVFWSDLFPVHACVPVLYRFSLTHTQNLFQNSKMLPPSKRFKMENSVPVHQNGIEMSIPGTVLYSDHHYSTLGTTLLTWVHPGLFQV